MKKRYILIMLLSFLYNICIIGDTVERDNLMYYLNKKDLTAAVGPVTKGVYGYINHYDVVILDKIIYNGITYIVTKIPKKAFTECQNITGVYMPNTIKEIGEGAFNQCHYLKKIKLSSNITVIKERTFSGCHSLEYLEIPEGVTDIEEYAFADCPVLQKLVLPSTIKNIKYAICDYCPKLKYINIKSSTPPNLNSYTFRMNDHDFSSRYLLVPFGAKSAYEDLSLSYFGIIKEGYLTEMSCGSLNDLISADIEWVVKKKEIRENNYTRHFEWKAEVRIKNNSANQIEIVNVTYYRIDTEGVKNLTTTGTVTGMQGLLNGYDSRDGVFTEMWNTKKDIVLPYVKIDYLYNGFLYSKYSGPIYDHYILCQEGDANGDGVVDELDLKEIEYYIMGGRSNYFVFNNADINFDGYINAVDLVRLTDIIMNNK